MIDKGASDFEAGVRVPQPDRADGLATVAPATAPVRSRRTDAADQLRRRDSGRRLLRFFDGHAPGIGSWTVPARPPTCTYQPLRAILCRTLSDPSQPKRTAFFRSRRPLCRRRSRRIFGCVRLGAHCPRRSGRSRRLSACSITRSCCSKVRVPRVPLDALRSHYDSVPMFAGIAAGHHRRTGPAAVPVRWPGPVRGQLFSGADYNEIRAD